VTTDVEAQRFSRSTSQGKALGSKLIRHPLSSNQTDPAQAPHKCFYTITIN